MTFAPGKRISDFIQVDRSMRGGGMSARMAHQPEFTGTRGKIACRETMLWDSKRKGKIVSRRGGIEGNTQSRLTMATGLSDGFN